MPAGPVTIEVGTVLEVAGGVARAVGLPRVGAEELVRFDGGAFGLALGLERDALGIALLDDPETVRAGDEVRRTGRVVDVPVGDALLGRVVDAVGRPVDGGGPICHHERRPVERDAPAILDRAPVDVPLATGIKVVDALVPIGRGQRELILGDRQTGKTAIALDTMINQRTSGVICVYCAVGQRGESVAKVLSELRGRAAFERCVGVVAGGGDPPGVQFIAPYAATTIAEYFMERRHDVLIVYDDLTRHARAYRELALLLRRPPGREAFPGDIFFIHSRLLERATHLRDALGGGSLTALPIIETQAQNLSAYIPTNLISITDGQIYLSPDLFRKGMLPAVDVGRSVSRVGGKAQLPAYRRVAGASRLSYAQFEELETFSRLGTRLDDATRRTLERGRRVREMLKQRQYQPLPVFEQITVLLAVTGGLFDAVPAADVAGREVELRRVLARELADVARALERGAELTDADRDRMLEAAGRVLRTDRPSPRAAAAPAKDESD
jgi:F-type H+-transporting ATPase subunit alpha